MSVAWLGPASAAELRDALVERPAAELRRLVAATPRAALDAALSERVRAEVLLDVLLEALPELVHPDALDGLVGVVGLAYTDACDGRTDRLESDGTRLRVLAPGEGGEPQTVLSLSAADLARLVTGSVNAAVLVLQGRLTASGDLEAVYRFGGLFRSAAAPEESLDPANVDPDEVAAVVRDLPPGQLEAVLSGPFGEQILEQGIARFPDFLDAAKAGDTDLRVRFCIDRTVFDAVVQSGRCEIERGVEHIPQLTVTLTAPEFLRLATGLLSPVNGVITRRLSISGDLQAGLRLHKIMRIPTAVGATR